MFFQFKNGLSQVSFDKINEDTLSVGYVTGDELLSVCDRLGFAQSTVEACRKANRYFRSGVEIYDDYTFTELRIIDVCKDSEDCVALYIKKNLILVVDVEDEDSSTRKLFMSALKRYAPQYVTLEKIIYAFFDLLVAGDIKAIEDMGISLSELEEQLIQKDADDDFNLTLLDMKKRLLRLRNYYEQMLDITEAIDENENDIFDSDCLMYISNLSKRVERLREDTDSLKNTVEHLQDAYSTYLDSKLNNTMKVFTVITTIFFPLTIIVGWYGMNFQAMPEFAWKYGYVYVIALSVIVVLALVVLCKRKKWF